MEEYDVLIVGASFEGLCLANYFAMNKKKVAIVELKAIKSISDDDKSIILSEKGIESLKEFFQIRIPSKFIENSFKAINFDFGEKSSMIEHESYLINERMLLYYIIGKIIELDNVDFYEKAEFMELLLENKRIIGAKIKSANIEKIKAKIIIDASGHKAAVRLNLKDNAYFSKFVEDELNLPFYEEIVECPELKGMKIIIDPEKKNSGMLLAIPKSNGKATLRLIAFDKIIDPEKYMQELKEKNFENCAKISSKKGQCPEMNPFFGFCYQNVALAGISAFQINPLIMEDCDMRLSACASICKELSPTLKLSEIYTTDLWPYNSSFMRKNGFKLGMLKILKSAIKSLDSEEIEYLMEKGIDAIMSPSGNFELNKSFLMGLIFKPKLAAKLAKIASISKKIRNIYSKYPEYDDFIMWKNEAKEII